MRTQEQVEILYKTYLKKCGETREKYDAGYDPYFYALNLGAATALGLTLGKGMKEIKRDVERTEKRYK